MVFQDAQDRRCAVNVHLRMGADDRSVNAEIWPATLSDIVTKLRLETKTKEIDALILDTQGQPGRKKLLIAYFCSSFGLMNKAVPIIVFIVIPKQSVYAKASTHNAGDAANIPGFI